jgi:hypothetical protein
MSHEYRENIPNLVIHPILWYTLKFHYRLLHGELFRIAEHTLILNFWAYLSGSYHEIRHLTKIGSFSLPYFFSCVLLCSNEL